MDSIRTAILVVAAIALSTISGLDASDTPVALDRGEIVLRASVFDPLQEGEPDFENVLPEGPPLRPPHATLGRYYLIQFHGPVTSAVRESLVERSVAVVGYVPSRTLIIRLDGQNPVEHLATVPGRRWIGPVRPGYKLSPGLADTIEDGVDPAESVSLDLTLFRGEDPDALARAIAKRHPAARVDWIKRRQPARLSLVVPGEMLGSLIGSVLRDPAVGFVSRRHPLVPHNDQSVWIGQSYDRAGGPDEALEPAPKPYLTSATIWNRGLTGEGQIVAVADTGLAHDMCFFVDDDHGIIAQTVPPPGALALNPEHRKILALNAPRAEALETDDSFRHGTHVAATVAGDDVANLASGISAGHDHGDGMAPAAKIVFEDISGSVTSGCNTSIVVNSIEDLLAQEYEAGARISSNSWGSSGDGFDVSTIEVDAAAWSFEEMLVVLSAGNRGGSGLIGFAECKNCLSVGAGETYDAIDVDELGIIDPENMTNFSSRGPTSDGRLKPDITAPGYTVQSARFPVEWIEDALDPACDPADPQVCLLGFGGCYRTDTAATCNVGDMLGTSMAAPTVAGLAVLSRQYFTDGFHPTGAANPADARLPSAALLKAMLINGARNMTGRRTERRGTPQDFGPLADAPSNTQGWGRVTLDDALYFAGDDRKLLLWDLPHATGFATGEWVEQTITVNASAQSLKVTLVWSDPPGEALAFGALVNDLDLELVAPGGEVYRGNQWGADDLEVLDDKESLPDAAGKDSVNNVEGVLLRSPAAGLYTVRVRGADIPGGAETLTQGAALVATGAIGACSPAAPPANLIVVDVSSNGVELSWSPVDGAVGYRLFRNGTTCGEPLAADHVESLSASETTFVDLSVGSQTAYHYTVRALVSAAGCQTADSNCISVVTPAAGPPPVPDGSFGTAMTATRVEPSGTAIELFWDVDSCPSSAYHVLYGPLDSVAALVPGGALCDPGNTGNTLWAAVPIGDLWFLVVGNDGAMVEGNWGETSNGAHRGGNIASGQCAITSRDNSGDCW